MKFCRDCKHRSNGISASSPQCFHPKLTRNYVDVVSGTFQTISRSCRFNRDEDICKDGEFWEEKVTLIGWIRKKLKG